MKKIITRMLVAFLLLPWAFASAQSCYEYSPDVTTAGYYVPFANNSTCSWSQMIYKPAQVGGTGNIYSVSFNVADYATVVDTSLVIYMGTTSDSIAETTASWIPMDSLTEVYRSSHYEHVKYVGWETFVLNTPFAYDGTKNLVICISSQQLGANTYYTYRYDISTNGVSMTRASSTAAYAEHPGTNTGTKRTYLPFAEFCFVGTCNAPKNPVASNITMNSATISWTASGYGEAGYEYLCIPSSETADWNNAIATSSNSISLSGLTPNTAYVFYVRSACSSSQNSNAAMTSFRTECLASMAIPYSENFDNQMVGGANILSYPDFVNCWNRFNDATTTTNQAYPYITNSTSYQRSGSGKCLYFTQQPATAAATLPANNVAILPQMAAPVNTLQISFWAKKSSATAAGYMVVGVMSDPTDFTTFTAVDTVNFDRNNSDYIQNTVYLNKYQGTGQYIALSCPKNRADVTTAIYFYVDDIQVDYLPTCFSTKAPELSAATPYSATVTWVANGTETQWEVQYKVTDSLTWINYPSVLTATNVLIDDLNGNTSYDVRVRAYCSASEQSDWSNALTFTTECEDFITIPFSANFDNEISGGASLTTYPEFAHCWSRLNDAPSDGSAGIPYVCGTTAYQRENSGKCIQFIQYPIAYAATTYATYQMAILPPVDPMMDPVSSLQLSFWAKKASTTMPGHFIIGVMTDPTDSTTFVPVETIEVETANSAYTYYTVPFYRYTGDGAYVAIKVPRNVSGLSKSQTSEIYIDDILLDYGPTCIPPLGLTTDSITSNSAMLDWTPGDVETEWNLQYKQTADSVWTSVPGTVTKPYTLQGLNAITSYDFRVRSYCSATDTSIWTDAATFTTNCEEYISIPYSHNFDSEATGAANGSTKPNFVNCWSRLNDAPTAGTSGIPYVDAVAAHQKEGSGKCVMFIQYPSTYNTTSYATYQMAILPSVDPMMDPVNTLQLSFWTKKSVTTMPGHFIVGVMTDPADATTFVPVDTIEVAMENNAYTYYSVPFEEYEGNGTYVAIKVPRNVSGLSKNVTANLYFDDILLDYLPACTAPTALVADSMTATSARLDWTPGNAETAWNLQYKLTADSVWTSVPGTVTKPYTLEGLNANTSYDFRVRSYCSAFRSSDWSDSVTFITNCDEFVTIPYSNNFDNEATGGTNGTTKPNFVRCWSRLNDAPAAGTSGIPYVASTAAYQREGSGKCVMFIQYPSTYSTTSYATYQMAIMPPVDPMMDPINSLQLNFWAKKASTSMPGHFIVGVMTDPADVTTFAPVDTIEVEVSNNAYIYYSVPFEEYEGNGTYVAIKVPRNVSGLSKSQTVNMYFDDILLDYIPACTTPTALTADSMTATSAQLDWTPGNAETAWNLQYKLTADSVWTSVPGSVTKPYTLEGLAANTSYDFRVRSYCSALRSSDWSDSVTFITNCEEFISIPYSHNFDSEATGGTNGTTKPNFVRCWSRLNDAPTAGYSGIPYVASTAAYQREGTGKCVMFVQYPSTYNTTSYPTYQMAILPSVDPMMDPVNSLQLNFWAKKASTTMPGHFIVGVMTDPSDVTTFAPVDTIEVEVSNNAYIYYNVSLHKYQGNGTHVAIKVPRNVSGLSKSQTVNMYFDDILLDYGPTCFAPTALATDSISYDAAVLDWTPGDVETEWNLQYKQTADSVWTSVAGTVTKPYTLQGLNENTNYDFRVRSYCSATDTSEWSDVSSFLTLIEPKYSITAVSNDVTMGTVTVSADSLHYGEIDTLVATPAPHHHFVRWSNGELNSTLLYTVTGDTTFTAYFAIDTFAVSVVVIGEEFGTVTNNADVDSQLKYYPYGTVINFTATPNAHADFVQWSDGTTSNVSTYTVVADTVITATFVNHAYNITALSSDITRGGATAAVESAFYGDTVMVYATPNDGFRLTNWDNGETTDTVFVVIASDTTITANFDYINYNVMVTAEDSTMGVVVETTNFAEYHYGDVAEFIAIANEGYEFIGWSNGVTSDTLSIVVTSDTTVTANFAFIEYIVNVTTADATMGIVEDVTELEAYHYGDVATFRAVANEGYEFAGWSNGVTSEELTLTITSDTTVTANFRVKAGVYNTDAIEYVAYTESLNIILHGAENQNVACYDASGKLIATVKSATEDQLFVVDQPGVYFIRVNNNKTISVVVK